MVFPFLKSKKDGVFYLYKDKRNKDDCIRLNIYNDKDISSTIMLNSKNGYKYIKLPKKYDRSIFYLCELNIVKSIDEYDFYLYSKLFEEDLDDEGNIFLSHFVFVMIFVFLYARLMTYIIMDLDK